jgi:hypothetical protein
MVSLRAMRLTDHCCPYRVRSSYLVLASCKNGANRHVPIRLCRGAVHVPCFRDVRRQRGRSRRDPIRLRSWWRIVGRHRAAPAVPRHHRQCTGARVRPDHCPVEAASRATARSSAAFRQKAIGTCLADCRSGQTLHAGARPWPKARHIAVDAHYYAPTGSSVAVVRLPVCRTALCERCVTAPRNPAAPDRQMQLWSRQPGPRL